MCRVRLARRWTIGKTSTLVTGSLSLLSLFLSRISRPGTPTLHYALRVAFRNNDSTTKHSGEGNAKTITLGLLLAFPSDRKTDFQALLASILRVSLSIIENPRSSRGPFNSVVSLAPSFVGQFLTLYVLVPTFLFFLCAALRQVRFLVTF